MHETPSAARDLAALRSCWHPVAFGAEVGAEPKANDLPETQLVLWRDSSALAHAFHDLWTSRT